MSPLRPEEKSKNEPFWSFTKNDGVAPTPDEDEWITVYPEWVDAYRIYNGEEAAGDASDLSVHRLDAGRLDAGRSGKRGGSVGLLAGLVVLGLGAGGYLWWQGREAGDPVEGGGRKREAALVLAGNKLPQALAQCDVEDGWNLRFQGAGFQAATRAHTGTGAFEALA